MDVRLLHYSDIEGAYDDPERMGRLAGAIAAHRDDRTLLVGTGDDVGPSVLSIATRGRVALEFFERVAPDVATFGNHDLDYGLGPVLEVIRDSPGAWVSANAYSEGRRLGADVGVVPSVVLEVGDERIGFFGVLDPETPSVTPAGEEITVTDPVEAAERAVADLREQGVDHVVALAHFGAVDELARLVDLDVILAGHVHEERIDRVAGTLLTRPGVGGDAIVAVTLADGSWTATRHAGADAPVDADVAGAFRDRLPEEYRQTVTTVDGSLDRSRESIDGGTARIGTVVADAYRWATGADVGLQHGAGIRAGPPLTGAVTVADLVGTVPYQDPVVVVEITGEMLLNLVARTTGPSVEVRGYWSGATVERTDGTEPEVRVGGAEVIPEDTYSLATTEFLARSGALSPAEDPIEVNRTGGSSGAEFTDRVQYEILIDYARNCGFGGSAPQIAEDGG